jgi:uncharacterized delta-60 repeat protein
VAKKKSISAPKIGMNRNTHPSQLENTEYTFLLNGNIETEAGETLNITNEPSNYLAIQFPDGYSVIGFKKHPVDNRTYYFLTNEQTGYSSIGYVDNIVSLDFSQDEITECPECEYTRTLPTPLENTTQTPYNEYVELFNDLCNKEFNFSINHPIKHIVIKVDKLGTKIYWVDDYNPDRWFDADNIDYFKTVGEDSCGEDNTQTVCVNTERMLQQSVYTLPTITPEAVQLGGNLRMGGYQYRVAYCDIEGNEISNYTSATQQVNIFDENNRILTQPQLDSFTNFGVRLRLENLDTSFDYYKVVVIERVAINQAEGYFELGIYSTSNQEIFHSSTQTGTENIGGITKRINYDRVLSIKPYYNHSKGIVSSANYLYKFGLTGKKYPNLQPVVNLIGGFLKWQTGVATEKLYKDPIANALYRGYNREEVQPFGIEFFNSDGSTYPIFPFISRPPKPSDLEIISESDLNYQSISSNTTDCITTTRNKRWQLFNTATSEGFCTNIEDAGTEVDVIETGACTISEVNEITSGEIIIPSGVFIDDVVDYINDNAAEISNPSSPLYNEDIADALNEEYEEECTPVFSSTCATPTLQNQSVRAASVDSQTTVIEYEGNLDSYPQTLPPNACQPYQISNTGEPLQDEDFQTDYGFTTVYKRQVNFINQICANAVQVIDNNNPAIAGVGYYGNYYGDSVVTNLYNASITDLDTEANFYDGLHTGALWFKINKNNRDKILFEITQNSDCSVSDQLSSILKLRYSIFNDCGDTAAVSSTVIDTTEGEKVIVDTTLLGDTFYVAIESPIIETPNSKYAVAPPCGCFSIYTRNLNVQSQHISYTGLVFDKIQEYSSVCTYIVPQANDCKPLPYQYGEFAYWESTDTYPDNKELYDSSVLNISQTDLEILTEQQKEQFEEYYTLGLTGNNYTLTADTDYRCKPIRHPKMPSNLVSPFMGTQLNAPFGEALIFPLGVTIDNNVINAFLNIAVKNNLLTQAQRDEIAGYKIVKGDNTLHKSIVANSVGFDMYKYTDKAENEVLYPNYPLNDLGEDILHVEDGDNIQHPYNSIRNHNFSVLAPEFSTSKPTLPSEIIVSGYQLGAAAVQFVDMEDHPKWVIMTANAKDTAGLLAGLEVALELALQIAELTVNSGIGQSWVIAGVSTGTNAPGTVISTTTISVYSALALSTAGLFKFGQYRLQWLETIRNLGQPRNYTAYSIAEGFHNTFLPNSITNSQLRGISSSKYMKSGNYEFRDENNGDAIFVNNFLREDSVFLSTGNAYPIFYPTAYSQYDNSDLGEDRGSRTIVSRIGRVFEQKAARKSAVPYITFKNYVANQFGTIDSIKWLDTSYQKYLSDNTSCEIIYGGSVYICRDYQERKHSIFTRTIFNQADLTKFNYSDYPNVATPKYYVDYEKGSEGSFFGTLFPDIDTEHSLDNVTPGGRSRFYYRSQCKFYTSYRGFVSYLTESEINTNFRYGGIDIKDQYYPDIQSSVKEFTQEKNRSIKEQPTYYYNSVYSRGVSTSPYITNPVNYSREIWDKINNAPNGIIRSLIDSSENNLTDPWLIYKPLDKLELSTEFGALISLEDLGSGVLLARMQKKELLLNSIDTLQKQLSAVSAEIGTGNVFDGRIIYSPAGTQTTDYAQTKYGNFSVDAKEGVVYQRNGQDTPAPISDITNQKQSGLKNWFKQHLPFKILRQYPNADVDNKFKGLGITIGVDNKTDRIFFTKKDYIVKTPECVEFDEELGFVINETLCGAEPEITCPQGYTYNPETQMCEKDVTYPACPQGYTYNGVTGMCEKEGTSLLLCPVGYTYDAESGTCTLDEDTEPAQTCPEGCTTIIQPDGNAMCVCPGEEIANQCTNCDIDVEYSTCEEGYTYNPATQKCEKIIDVCPPNEGYYVGGQFTSPDARLYNSVNNMPNINNGAVRRIKRQKDGKLLIAGSFTSTAFGTINGLLRLNVDGSQDTSFNIGSGFTNTVSSMAVFDIDVDSQGRILVVGTFTNFNGQPNNNGIIRLNPNGSKDNTFNNSIGFTSSIGTPSGLNYVVRVVEDDKILVGCANVNYKNQPAKGVIKLNEDGSVDTTFDGGNRFNSFVFTDTLTGVNGTNNWNGEVTTIEVQPNGYYLIGGKFNEYNGILSRRLIRIKQNGDIDYSFNVGAGFLDIATYSYQCYVYKVQMQGNKILAAGRFKTYKGQPVEGIVRLNLDGSLDSTFNNNKVMGGADAGGRVVTDFDTNTEGEILMGGYYTSYDGNNIANFTLTDVNGNAVSFPDTGFNSSFNQSIYAVLNEPRCEECVNDDCMITVLLDDTRLCSCLPSATNPTCVCTLQQEPTTVDTLTPIGFDNTAIFQDCSWTVAYKPTTGTWVGYYSFKPNYYMEQDLYFQTGFRGSTVWSHLLNMNSFQVFQGQKYPFIIEFPVVNENVNKIFESLSLNTEVKRWQNNWDYTLYNLLGFNKIELYNHSNHSGLLELVQQQVLRDQRNYPQQVNNISQKTLYTTEDGKHTLNYFFNRVKSINNGLIHYINDINNIEKTLNPQVISFRGKSLLERMRGEWLLVRLTNDAETRLSVMLKQIITDENGYN